MFDTVFRQLLQRPVASHKFDFGHVLVLGGSPGMAGAAILTATAALRCGAGLVTIGAGAGLQPELVYRPPEIMTATIDTAQDLATFITERNVSVVAIGPGLQPSATVRAQLEWLLQQPQLSLIIDGGALSALQGHVSLLDGATCKGVILTPHLGEFKRLLDSDLPAERSEQIELAQAFADTHPVTVILKGQPTVVTTRALPAYQNDTGNPGLATAGSGDVLTGIIAAFAAQGIAALTAAQAAIYIHGLAGDIASTTLTQPAVNAGDIVECIAVAYKQIEATL